MILQDKQLVEFIVDKLDDLKAKDIFTINVEKTSSITDYLVICTATSSRHAASIADHLIDECKKAGLLVLGSEGKSEADWVVVDCDSVMVHVMQEESRIIYELEKLWG